MNINKGVESISLDPFLLNSKEAVVVKVLLANFKGNITAEARIVGTRQVLDTNIEVDSSNQSFTALNLAVQAASNAIPLVGPLAGEITSVALESTSLDQEDESYSLLRAGASITKHKNRRC